MTKLNQRLLASKTPLQDLELITQVNNPNQHPSRRQYRGGYEFFFEQLMIIEENDLFTSVKADYNKRIMQQLAAKLVEDGWLEEQNQSMDGFARTILAMEEPSVTLAESNTDPIVKEGKEILVAHWGRGFSSPVHGHAPGYEHEEVLSGSILVNSYRMIDPRSTLVRLVKSEIVSKGTFISEYTKPDNYQFERPMLIHNFVTLETSHTLHYLAEHTRDGRDNAFVPQYFEDTYLTDLTRVKQVYQDEVLHSKIGEVYLVRSNNVSGFGDHYIVITGGLKMKPWGLRPEELTISAPKAGWILDEYNMSMGATLLKLDESATRDFYAFHGIEMVDGKVVLPTQESLVLN